MWLIKKAKIIDPASEHHLKIKDIAIDGNIIVNINDQIDAITPDVIELEGLHVSVGWFDVGVYLGEPGQEHRETKSSLNQACITGGFTTIATSGNETFPILTKSDLSFLNQPFDNQAITILPLGAVTMDQKGKDLSEMYDLKTNGAIAFSDHQHTIQDPSLMIRALEYCKIFDGLILQTPTDSRIAAGGMMHEGKVSTHLGLKGIPSLAEIVTINRDLELLKYVGSKLHFSSVTTAEGVELIRNAKSQGLQVTCSVNVHNLVFTDENLEGFDSNLKLFPPLRTQRDLEALWQGLLDGTINYVESGHLPCDPEIKAVEFPYAAFGAIGLETIFSLLCTYAKPGFDIVQVINHICYNQRKLFGQENTIANGSVADLTFFNPKEVWTFQEENIGSLGKNTPCVGMPLTGKVIGTFAQQKFHPNSL